MADDDKLPSWADDTKTYARYREIVDNATSYGFTGVACGWAWLNLKPHGEMRVVYEDGQSITTTGRSPMDAAEAMDVVDGLTLVAVANQRP